MFPVRTERSFWVSGSSCCAAIGGIVVVVVCSLVEGVGVLVGAFVGDSVLIWASGVVCVVVSIIVISIDADRISVCMFLLFLIDYTKISI